MVVANVPVKFNYNIIRPLTSKAVLISGPFIFNGSIILRADSVFTPRSVANALDDSGNFVEEKVRLLTGNKIPITKIDYDTFRAMIDKYDYSHTYTRSTFRWGIASLFVWRSSGGGIVFTNKEPFEQFGFENQTEIYGDYSNPLGLLRVYDKTDLIMGIMPRKLSRTEYVEEVKALYSSLKNEKIDRNR